MLTLICGMPRAGKTTYSKNFVNVIHADGIGYQAVKKRVSKTLGDIAVDGIYEHPQLRTRLAEVYKGQGKKCVWLDTPLDVRKTRPMWQPYFGLDFVPPTLVEGWDEIIIIRGDDNVERINRETED